jgi:adenine-specific DNA-methyltransferase
MEHLIREKKVIWPVEDHVACYGSVEEIREAIRAGNAPKALRLGESPEDQAFWERELEFWVGKTIGYRKPRYKRHQCDVKRSEKPLSTWILPAATKKKEREQMDLEGLELMEAGYTSDGTSLLQEILGHKEFPYPKPLAIAQALIAQATGPDDIVCDFFAGSGTTAHAVLAQNAEDDGDRRFILVSNTEATAAEPDKNICRDITRQRLGLE